MTRPTRGIGRFFMLLALVGVLAGCAGIGAGLLGDDGAAAVRPQKAPNILFIFTDDHASHAIGAYGSRFPGDTAPGKNKARVTDLGSYL